jgi:hypothetical protein
MTGKVLALAFGVMLAGFASVAAAEETPVFRDPAMLSLGSNCVVARGTDAGSHARER